MKQENINEVLDYIQKEFLKPLWEELQPEIKGFVKTLSIEIAKETVGQLKTLIRDLVKSKKIYYESADELTKSDMVSYIRLNRVNGSDGVAAFKQTKGDKTILYLAFCKDRDLLPADTNCYIVIEANSLNEDVKELFKESDLIILN